MSSEVGAGADNGDFAVTVLGCSGSYNSAGSPCSGYLVRAGGKNLWLDCGNGTLTNLQRHIDPAAVDAIVVTHSHPDHCVDLFGMHVLATYGLERAGIPVIAAPDVEACMRPLARSWKSTFDWQEVGDGDRTEIGGMQLHFLRTDHPVPTLAVEMRAAGKRFVYTADTGPTWSPEAFEPGADLLLSEATYLHDDRRSDIHISAKQAGTFARDARAQRLVLTHLWPTVDRALAQAEGSDAFGDAVALAAVHDHYTL
ncbi:MAG TPA: MBL fold metallo-hydrolase [Acidimicrobiia bacterium]